MQTTNNTEKKNNIYEMVTKNILKRLMKGDIPWRNTWTAGKGKKHPYTNHFTGKPYSFLNTLLLEEPGEYATFKQIKDAKGRVVKGAHSKPVIYWGEYVPKENKEEKERLEKEGKDWSHLKVKFPKFYLVFNVRDTEGLDLNAKEHEETVKAEAPTDIIEMAIDDYTRDYGVSIEEQDSEPAYLADEDKVIIPEMKAFTYEEDYFAALAAQLVHSTATPQRCDRKKEMKNMSEKEMTIKEELIAEIGSSMILSVAGLNRKETKEQQAAVCQKWIEAMESDYKLLVSASYGAEKAAKLVLGEFAA